MTDIEALRGQVPEAVGDRCVKTLLDEPYTIDFYQVDPPRMPKPGDIVHACTSDGTVLGSFVWPEPGEPSTLREDLEAAIEVVSDAPYQPVTRYRHPADAPKSHGN